MTFTIDIREKHGLRTLHFDSGWMQGAMHIGQPWALALEYTRVMMAVLLLREESRFPRNVLLIGLGAGSLAKFLYRHCPSACITAVEIDARVAEAARRHFELPDDAQRLQVVIGDGAEHIRSTDQTYDLIMVDGFNERAHPGDLNTLPFYQACRARLGGQGLLAVNLIGLSHGVKGGFAHIEEAFDHRAVLFPRCKSGNSIAFAASGDKVDLALAELQERARALEGRTGLALLPVICKLDDAPECAGGRFCL
ncbi:MAG: fused MFS/spermidine synthase [Nitrosomonadales bacterium]|nr:fused MFS/spermidine synthase [Nitrosomonadales bacterium]